MADFWYTSLEEVSQATDIALTIDVVPRLAQVMDEAMDAVHGQLRRVFYPTVGTRTFAWPQDRTQSSRVLVLGQNEMIAVTGAINGDGSTMDVSTLKLGPAECIQPPYTRLFTSTAFVTNTLFPDSSVQVSGTFGGAPIDEFTAAQTVTNLAGSSVTVNDSSKIGVGDLIRIGTERLGVTAKSWVDAGNVVPVTLTDSSSSNSFLVTSGAAFHVGEVVMIDAEQMLITSIAGNLLVVRRNHNNSGLDTHTAVATVYVNRVLTVARGLLGTTQFNTLSGADVSKFRFPGLVRQLHRAEAINITQQDSTGYARMSGSGQGDAKQSVDGLIDLRERSFRRHGRMLSGII